MFQGPRRESIKPKPDLRADCHAGVRAAAEVSLGLTGLVEMIDTFDRPDTTFTTDTYADAGTYAEAFTDKHGKRVPKAGLYAGAGVGLARAECSIFEIEVKGPNASAAIGASLASLSVGAFAKAEVASASYSAGPLKAKAGLAVDIGASVGVTGVELKILGTGFSFGRKMGISFFGSGVEFNIL